MIRWWWWWWLVVAGGGWWWLVVAGVFFIYVKMNRTHPLAKLYRMPTSCLFNLFFQRITEEPPFSSRGRNPLFSVEEEDFLHPLPL